jgi:lysozyme
MDESILEQHIIWAEAERLQMYKDSVGIWTIGVGHNIQEKGISRAVSRMILKEDINETLEECRGLPYWDTLDPVRRIAVADMVFNLGLSRFLKFKNFNAALTAKDYVLASVEMQESKWWDQVGRRAVKLQKAMITGVWDA